MMFVLKNDLKHIHYITVFTQLSLFRITFVGTNNHEKWKWTYIKFCRNKKVSVKKNDADDDVMMIRVMKSALMPAIVIVTMITYMRRQTKEGITLFCFLIS